MRRRSRGGGGNSIPWISPYSRWEGKIWPDRIPWCGHRGHRQVRRWPGGDLQVPRHSRKQIGLPPLWRSALRCPHRGRTPRPWWLDIAGGRDAQDRLLYVQLARRHGFHAQPGAGKAELVELNIPHLIRASPRPFPAWAGVAMRARRNARTSRYTSGTVTCLWRGTGGPDGKRQPQLKCT